MVTQVTNDIELEQKILVLHRHIFVELLLIVF